MKTTLITGLLLIGFACGAAADEDPGLAKRISTLVSQLDDKEYKTREAATAALIEIGKPALPALRKLLADKPSEEARARAKRAVFAIDWPAAGKAHDGLQLTVKTPKKKFWVGESITLTVRLTSTVDAPRKLQMMSDGLGWSRKATDPELGGIVRLVVIDEAKKHKGIGFFANLNRGPSKMAYTVKPKSVATAKVTGFLGYRTGKGSASEGLAVGTYKVYAKLGDVMGEGWWGVRLAKLRSNEITIQIRPRPKKR